MDLTPEQKSKVLSMLKDHTPPWHINAYLHQLCGLTFREAIHTRKAVEEEAVELEKKRIADAAANRIPIVTVSNVKVDACITCGSKDFSCPCKVKRPGDMDF